MNRKEQPKRNIKTFSHVYNRAAAFAEHDTERKAIRTPQKAPFFIDKYNIKISTANSTVTSEIKYIHSREVT